MNFNLLKQITIIIIGSFVIFILYVVGKNLPADSAPAGAEPQIYYSPTLGITFQYPNDYFAVERELGNGERTQREIILMEDTEENRKLVQEPGSGPAREGPPSISIEVFQNNLDGLTAETFVHGTNFSNFKLSDGKLEEKIINENKWLWYHATGLYENDNAVIAQPSFVYMFTVNYLNPQDKIAVDFDKILKTVEFLMP